MKKKLLAMLLSSAMLAGILAGCSSGTSEDTAASEPAGTSEAVEIISKICHSIGGRGSGGDHISLGRDQKLFHAVCD